MTASSSVPTSKVVKRANDDTSKTDEPTKKAPKLAPMFARAAGGAVAQQPWTQDLIGRNVTCWHGCWGQPEGRSKVLALDLDGTVITTRSGNKFPSDHQDFRWWNTRVPTKIRRAFDDGFAIVFISNQAGSPKSQSNFQRKLPLIAQNLGGGAVPFHCFAALDYDEYRKPATGMWDAFVANYNGGVEVDLASSLYVGDAAGRPRDHSDTDRKMALNADLPFATPEEYFLDQPATPYSLKGWDSKTHDHGLPLYTPTNIPLVPSPSPFEDQPVELVLFVGSPASGKTTLFSRHFAPAGYVHVNQDTLKTRDRCIAAVRAAMAKGQSVVIDNTSPARATRKLYLDVVRSEFPTAKIRILHFTAPRDVCMHNSVHRASLPNSTRAILPKQAFDGYWSQFQAPQENEGFDSIQHINFAFEGSPSELKRWQRWYNDVYPKGRRF